MKQIQTVVIIGLLLLICFVPSVSAVEDGYYEQLINVPSIVYYPYALPISGDVTQGEVDYHVYHIPQGSAELEVSLTWNIHHGNNLRLKIYPPSGSPFIYDDSSDGELDGRIALRTQLPIGMTGSNWRFDVIGLSVVGSQSYTLTINI